MRLDQRTDIRQLNIFTRIVQDDYSCIEELLDFVILRNTTTGLDIFLAVEETLKKFDMDFSKFLQLLLMARKLRQVKEKIRRSIKAAKFKYPHYSVHNTSGSISR